MDPIGTPRDQMSMHGMVHRVVARIVLLLMPLSCFVFVPGLRREQRWRAFGWWTVAAGTTVVLAVTGLAVATMVVSTQAAFVPWLGLGIIQRAAVVPYMVWLFIFALMVITRRGRR